MTIWKPPIVPVTMLGCGDEHSRGHARSEFVCSLVPPRSYHLGRLARIPRFAVRFEDDRRSVRHLQRVHSYRSNLRPRPGWSVGGALASPSSWRYAQSSWPASMSIENSSHPVSEEQFSSSTNSKQARVIFRYVRALLTNIPMLAKMIERETVDAFDLSNSVTIKVHPASAKSIRGYAVVAALLDEVAFFPTDDSANPDYDILDALRPGMATIPNAMLLC